MPSLLLLSPALFCHVLACAACPALPCSALPCPALPCSAMSCAALPCPVLPCPVVPCPALSRSALPCQFELDLTGYAHPWLVKPGRDGSGCRRSGWMPKTPSSCCTRPAARATPRECFTPQVTPCSYNLPALSLTANTSHHSGANMQMA